MPFAPCVVWSVVIGSSLCGAGLAAAQGWHPAARLGAEVRFDDNPFLLTPTQKDRLRTLSAADVLSGRFRDMTSATDAIPVAGAEVALEGPGLLGRALEVSARAVYEANAQNARRRHAELTFDIAQSLPKTGRLRLRVDWRPSYFPRNYLSDATDLSGDGNISADERVYRAATSREVDLSLNYRHRLMKSRESRPVGVTGELALSYFARSHDASFVGRDRRGPGVGAGVAVELGPRWTVGLDYAYQSLGADTVREVLILDETAFGVDFNGVNGASDADARAFELVDRSLTDQNLRASVETALSGAVTLQVAYVRRTRAFGSTQPYDVSDRGRHDTRNELEVDFAVRFAHDLRLTLAGTAAQQKTNRAGDPGSTGEVVDYSRRVVTARFEYRFQSRR